MAKKRDVGVEKGKGGSKNTIEHVSPGGGLWEKIVGSHHHNVRGEDGKSKGTAKSEKDARDIAKRR